MHFKGRREGRRGRGLMLANYNTSLTATTGLVTEGIDDVFIGSMIASANSSAKMVAKIELS